MKKLFELKDGIFAEVEWVSGPPYLKVTYFKSVKRRCLICNGRGCQQCYQTGNVNERESFYSKKVIV